MNQESTDVLVIGAGPAGTVAASLVHQAGFKVSVVEKTMFPRFVIGESLLPRCMEALEEAGFLPAIMACNFQKKYGAKFVKNGKICDYIFADQFTKGWTWTWQVPRADFDKVLADAVETMGVRVHYQSTVTGIEFNGSNSVTTLVDAQGHASQIQARFIIDGSGYGRVITSLLKMERPSNLPPRKALFAHTADIKRSLSEEPDRITIVVHQPGVWVWIIPFSNGVTSLGFVGDPAFFKQASGGPEEQLRQLIASEAYLMERFGGVKFVFGPKILESWSVTTDRFYGDGFVLAGNATEFLDPVFSSGVTLATVSSQMAGKLVIEKLKGRAIDWEKEYTRPMMQGVDTFRSYVMAWYDGTLEKIFFADNQDPSIKSQVCSVLAGYVWDLSNPYVANHKTALQRLAAMIEYRDSLAKNN